MFGYLKIFAIVSFIAVLVIAGMVGMYFRSQSGDDLQHMAERNNVLVTNSFLQELWYPFERSMHQNKAIDPKLRTANAAAHPQFHEAAKSYVKRNDAPMVAVIRADGSLLYTSGDQGYLMQNIQRRLGIVKAGGKRVTSNLIEVKIKTGDGKMVERTLVLTTTRLAKLKAQDLYLESYTDITKEYNRVILLQWVASGSIIIVFLILIWTLLIMSAKAEKIIAKQHEDNTDLVAKAAVAEAASEQKSMFLASISHELRTPLNAVIGFSEIMQSEMHETIPDTRYQGYITDIHEAGVHLLSLINDILDFTKAEAGKLEFDTEEVNASKLVKQCIRLVETRAELANIHVINAMPKEAVVMHTDGKKLKQILLNLLSNAVKFTPAGGEVTITAWRNVTDETIGFEVRDTGIGISPKDISKALSPFGQVDSSLARKYEGTGLGLPLTKKFVELMDGEFNMNSQLDQGTTISFTLPCKMMAASNPVKKANS